MVAGGGADRPDPRSSPPLQVGPTGVKVIDRGKINQDHAVAVRGVVAQLTTAGPSVVLASTPNFEERWAGLVERSREWEWQRASEAAAFDTAPEALL